MGRSESPWKAFASSDPNRRAQALLDLVGEASGRGMSGCDLEGVLRQACRDDSPSVRAVAAMVVARLRPFWSLEVLRGLLEDEAPWVRMSAVRALGELGGGAVVEVLFERLDREKDSVVLEALLEVLGRLGDDQVALRLLEWLSGSVSDRVRVAGLWAVARCGGEQALRELEVRLSRTRNLLHARQLAYCLGYLAGRLRNVKPATRDGELLMDVVGGMVAALLDEGGDSRFLALLLRVPAVSRNFMVRRYVLRLCREMAVAEGVLCEKAPEGVEGSI